MPSVKNWDNKNWLSSKKYIDSFIKFLLNQKKLKRDSKILDIGCGRGKIIGTLKSKLKLSYFPIGLDIENHKDKDKRFHFKKNNGIDFLKKNKQKFDLILIKQSIHFFSIKNITILINLCEKNLKPLGKILILSLENKKNEIPSFVLMKKKLTESMKRDKKIRNVLMEIKLKKKIKIFKFKVILTKKKYSEMINQRYISCLLDVNKKQITDGLKEIDINYKDLIKFNDRLECLILEK